MELEWHPFELHPGIPPEGMPIPWSPERLAAARANFERLAQQAGLEVGPRTHWYDSAPAHEANLWAEERGAADALRRAIFRAYFVYNRNIASPDVLTGLAARQDLDAADLRVALAEGRYRQRVLDQYEQARRLGVTSVPTFVTNGYALIGAQPYEVFRQFLSAAKAAGRSP